MKKQRTKLPSKTREDLVKELHELQSKESECHNQIEQIDFANTEKERQKYIGKYFDLRSDNDFSHGFFKIEKFKKENPSMVYGVLVNTYSEKENKDSSFAIELNTTTFFDWVKKGKQITKAKFHKRLKLANDILKTKI